MKSVLGYLVALAVGVALGMATMAYCPVFKPLCCPAKKCCDKKACDCDKCKCCPGCVAGKDCTCTDCKCCCCCKGKKSVKK